jgi:hypothetical protein
VPAGMKPCARSDRQHPYSGLFPELTVGGPRPSYMWKDLRAASWAHTSRGSPSHFPSDFSALYSAVLPIFTRAAASLKNCQLANSTGLWFRCCHRIRSNRLWSRFGRRRFHGRRGGIAPLAHHRRLYRLHFSLCDGDLAFLVAAER